MKAQLFLLVPMVCSQQPLLIIVTKLQQYSMHIYDAADMLLLLLLPVLLVTTIEDHRITVIELA